MNDLTRPIRGFPGYSISSSGQVWNDDKERPVKHRINMYGTPIVMLRNHEEGRQYGRSVPSLVIKMWGDEPPRRKFDTVVHIDGDHSNCNIENLTLRPRYLAIAYHDQMSRPPRYTLGGRAIRVIETGEIFQSIRDCAIAYVALDREIFFSSYDDDRGFVPVYYHIEIIP